MEKSVWPESVMVAAVQVPLLSRKYSFDFARIFFVHLII
jgi:hypothetical protein